MLVDVGLDHRLWGRSKDSTLRCTALRAGSPEAVARLLAQVILRQPFLALLDEATSARLGSESRFFQLAPLAERS